MLIGFELRSGVRRCDQFSHAAWQPIVAISYGRRLGVFATQPKWPPTAPQILTSISSTACRSKLERLMTLSTSPVAV